MRDDDLAPLRDLLAPITKRLGLGGAAETATVWRRWSEIVGPGVAAHAEPTSLRDGILRVRTDSPVWATEIGYLADEIRRRINAAVGGEAVRRVVIWTGPRRRERPGSSAPSGGRPDPTVPDPPADPVDALARLRATWERRFRGAR